MSNPLFDRLEQTLESQGSAAGFDLLIRDALEQKNYALLFEIRLMQKRHAMGLPLIQNGTISELPPQHQSTYEAFVVETAREAGNLYLADGNIARAWPYFRAINDPGPVRDALERTDGGDDLDSLIEIALREGVNPRRGFDLLMQRHGTCRAIDFAVQYTDRAHRPEFLRRLVRALHGELIANLKEAIAREEPTEPETNDAAELIDGRDWLFEAGGYYVENSHLGTMLHLSLELSDPETLRLAWQMAEYGKRLAPMLQFPGTPPFQDLYLDHASFLGALLGKNIDHAVAHFRNKVAAQVPGSPEALIGLLARLGRYPEAIQLSEEHLRGAGGYGCPSAIELCRMAGDYARLSKLAREQGDLLGFTAGLIEKSSATRPRAS